MRLTTRRRNAAPPFPALGKVLDFMRLIWVVDHALQETSRRTGATLGVTGPQRLVIRIFDRFPDVPAGHLAGVLHLHPSTLTGLLARLERQALTTRQCDRWDGRKWLVVLTSKGPRFDVRTEGTVEMAVRRALAGVSPRRLRSARDVLVALSQALRHQTARLGHWAASATGCPSGCP